MSITARLLDRFATLVFGDTWIEYRRQDLLDAYSLRCARLVIAANHNATMPRAEYARRCGYRFPLPAHMRTQEGDTFDIPLRASDFTRSLSGRAVLTNDAFDLYLSED
jgi:hypothetical protein